MSELKAGVIKTPHDEGMSFNRDSDHVAVTEGETEFYLKSEVDKVIARSKEKLVEQTTLRVWAELQLRHNKYKRCLAMANWCFMKSNYHYFVGREKGWQFAKDNFHRSNLYSNWWQRWLKIAEQFKENK